MAKKRMFSPQVVASDAFLALPFTAQALYIQLNLEADDDGIIGQRIAIRMHIWKAICSMATSEVSLVTMEDVESLSILEKS